MTARPLPPGHTRPVDRSLLPEGWRPRTGGHVRILGRPNAAPDEPLPPPGVWWVVDRAPEPQTWWVHPLDAAAHLWVAEQAAGRARSALPVGWPAQAVPGRRLAPASTAVRDTP